MKILCAAAMMALLASSGSAQEGVVAEPGKEHDLLTKNLGTRTGTMKMWPAGPESPPVEMPFKEVNTAIHNGFWVVTDFEAGPYNGRGMNGYDPLKKKYIGTWTNNMSPFMSVMEGTYDAATHELTMSFQDFDHEAGKLVDMKSVTNMTPGKAEKVTMYRKATGTEKWVKAFVMTYETKKE